MSGTITTKNKRRTFDWLALKKEFLTKDYRNISDFKREKGISLTVSVPFKGWVGEKREMQTRVIEATKNEVIKTEVESIQEVKERQARIARYMQLKGEEELKQVTDLTADDARKLVTSGMQEERKILGLEGNGKGPSLTQININPRTNIDKLLEGLDYEGTLELIAEIKRERARRTLPGDTDEGSGEIEDGEVL